MNEREAPLFLPGGLPPDQNPAAVYLAGLSPGSRPTMRQALQTIATELGEQIETMPWHRLRYQHTQAIRSRLAERFAPNTTNKMLSALRGVLREAKRLGLMSIEDYSNAVDFKSVPGERIGKGRALSENEIKKMFSVLDPSASRGARDAAMLAAMYSGGLRRSEVAGIDLDLYRDGTLHVLGKGNKERIVPLDEGAREAMENWIAIRGSASGPMFVPIDRWGHPRMHRMNARSVTFVLEDIAERAGIKPVAAHDMRRTFITTLLDRGVDLSTAQRLAGHRQVTTTTKYDKRGEKEKAAAVAVLRTPFERPQ